MDALPVARARPILLFALFAAVTLAAELAVVTSPKFPLHPQAMTLAVIFDVAVALPAAWWLLVVRPGVASKRSVLRIARVCIALCALLVGAKVRALAIPLEVLFLYWVFRAARAAMHSGGDALQRLRTACVAALGDNAIARAVAAEFSVLYFALAPARRQQGFAHGQRPGWSAVAFALGLVTLAEAIPVELWLRRYGAAPAMLAGAFHLYAMLWLLGDARALRNRLTRIESSIFRLRLGLRWEADILLGTIESVEIGPAPVGSLQLRVLGATNLVVRFREPVEVRGFWGISRQSRMLAVQVDDPQALAAALRPAE